MRYAILSLFLLAGIALASPDDDARAALALARQAPPQAPPVEQSAPAKKVACPCKCPCAKGKKCTCGQYCHCPKGKCPGKVKAKKFKRVRYYRPQIRHAAPAMRAGGC